MIEIEKPGDFYGGHPGTEWEGIAAIVALCIDGVMQEVGPGLDV